VSSSGLAYSFFRTAAEAQSLGAETASVRFVVEPRSAKTRDGVLATAIAVRELIRQGLPTSGGGDGSGAPPPVFVRVVSTDHLLQRLSDIEELTPVESPLRPLRDLGADIAYEHVSDPYSYSACPDAKRQARHVRLSEQLCAVLANLRGVAASTDLLHPDNGVRLAEVKTRLSKELWELLPSRGGHRASHSPLTRGSRGSSTADKYGNKDADLAAVAREQTCELVCVETAVGALGKAQDALGPLLADPIRGRISPEALRIAQDGIASAVAALRQTDPDRPISTEEWLALANGETLRDCPVARGQPCTLM